MRDVESRQATGLLKGAPRFSEAPALRLVPDPLHLLSELAVVRA